MSRLIDEPAYFDFSKINKRKGKCSCPKCGNERKFFTIYMPNVYSIFCDTCNAYYRILPFNIKD